MHTHTHVIKYDFHSLMRYKSEGGAADDAADAVIRSIHPSAISLICLHLVAAQAAVSETGNFMV